jgi:hypothetical protein
MSHVLELQLNTYRKGLHQSDYAEPLMILPGSFSLPNKDLGQPRSEPIWNYWTSTSIGQVQRGGGH